MAILGRLLTNWTEQDKIRSLSVRFTAITKIHATVTGSATVRERTKEGDEDLLVLDLVTHTQDNQQTSGLLIVLRVCLLYTSPSPRDS